MTCSCSLWYGGTADAGCYGAGRVRGESGMEKGERGLMASRLNGLNGLSAVALLGCVR